MTEETLPIRIAVDDPPSDDGATATGPVQPSERMVLVDVLRGFALLGILQVNWWWSWGPESVPPILRDLLGFFVDGSFYTTFSFLFGLGFAIQLIRAEEANRPFVLRHLWRLLIMFFIGAAHEIFIWGGDIVKGYALAGVMLLVVCRFRAGLIVALAAAVLVLAMAPRLAPDWRVLTRTNPEQVETVRLRDQARSAAPQRKTLPYGQFVQAQAIGVWELVTERVTTFQWWLGERCEWLCMFFLGLYAGRRRLFRDAEQHTRFFVWVGAVALVFGLAGNALDGFPDFFAGIGIVLPKAVSGWSLTYSLGNIGLALFYMAGITLLFTHRASAQRLLAPLAYVGRMGLTNYIMQSVILELILGRGFGLIDRPDGLQGWSNFLLINAFFAVQIIYSFWWFQYFRFGPVEWAWRSLTWFRLQPMRAKQLVET